jgi:hypothetical protein
MESMENVTMLRRLLTGVTAAATALLGACQDAPRSTVLFSSGQANTYLDYAASRGPLLVETMGMPFSGSPATLTQAVGDLVRSAITRRVITTTGAASEAGDAGFRLKMAFNGGAAQDPNHLCATNTSQSGSFASPNTPGERLDVLAVFCNGQTLEVAVRGSVAYPSTAQDDQFAALIKQVTRQLFP